MASQVELGLIGASPFAGRQGRLRVINTVVQTLQIRLNLVITGLDLSLVKAIGLHSLRQHEQMLGSVIAFQGLGDAIGAASDAMILEGGQLLPVTLTCKNRIDDAQPGLSGDIAYDLMQLDIHLFQGLLHLLHLGSCITDEAVPMAPVGTQHTDLVVGTKGGRKQAKGVQLLEPLTVLHVAFATRHILDVARIDQVNLKAIAFQNLEQGHPIDAGRFDGHRVDPTPLQPTRKAMKILRKAGETTHGTLIAIFRHGHIALFGTNVDASCIGMNHFLEGLPFGNTLGPTLLGHDNAP